MADAFEEVQRAQQDQERFQREAERYANKRLGEARGEAARIRQAALAYKERVVMEAQGESERFLSVYGAYKEAKNVTRKRLYLETMEGILANTNKVIVGHQAGTGVVPYLPLKELRPGDRDGESTGEREEGRSKPIEQQRHQLRSREHYARLAARLRF